MPTSPNTSIFFNNDSMKIAQELMWVILVLANNVVASEFVELQNRVNARRPSPQILVRPIMVDDTLVLKPPIPGHRYIGN